ncbi:MAG: xanthine dehydrogenase small subunit [Hyphomicrobiales bacterium]|nr:xanthine dehydrogenase small subunit [Hyphomicrobiales bacterium]
MTGHDVPPPRREVRFLLGDEAVAVAPTDPTRTLLDFLREDRRLVGTKEGCAEGDCGACTVAVGRARGVVVAYEAMDSCILPLAALDGLHVLTIEHVGGADGAMHPVQAAMVARHGSQCGFCTPGIVMSLYAQWRGGGATDEAAVEDALAGNLCRCTGYAPIVAAAMDAAAAPKAADPRGARVAEVAARLAALDDGAPLEIAAGGRTLHAPVDLDGLAALCIANPDAVLIAGATDVGLRLTKALQRPAVAILLGRVRGLDAIEDLGGEIRLGAGVTIARAREVLGALDPQIDEWLRRFGGAQVRNAGTVGGNVANGSPIGDLPPLLIALGATLRLRRGDEVRAMPLEDFFVAYGKQDRRPGEFVLDVIARKPGPHTLFHASKVTKRFDEDISTLAGAFRLDLGADGRVEEARLAFGGMAGTPKRASAAERALVGRPFDGDAAEAAVRALDFAPLDDHRASARYRALVAANLLRRFAREVAHGPARVAGRLAEDAHA